LAKNKAKISEKNRSTAEKFSPKKGKFVRPSEEKKSLNFSDKSFRKTQLNRKIRRFPRGSSKTWNLA